MLQIYVMETVKLLIPVKLNNNNHSKKHCNYQEWKQHLSALRSLDFSVIFPLISLCCAIGNGEACWEEPKLCLLFEALLPDLNSGTQHGICGPP